MGKIIAFDSDGTLEISPLHSGPISSEVVKKFKNAGWTVGICGNWKLIKDLLPELDFYGPPDLVPFETSETDAAKMKTIALREQARDDSFRVKLMVGNHLSDEIAAKEAGWSFLYHQEFAELFRNDGMMQKKFLNDKEESIPYISVKGKPLASLVILSFNRPQFLHQTIASLKRNTTYPHELIVVDDGSMAPENVEFLMKLYRAKEISSLILNAGKNLGVGAGINRGFHASHGKYLFKLDSDLEYKPGWLEKAIGLMETFPEVGVMGLFKYHYEPCIWQKMFIRTEERDGLKVEAVKDFVGSTMVFSREIYEKFGDLIEGSWSFGEDFMKKMEIKKAGYWLALPPEDLVSNFGFGEPYTSLLWEGKEVGVSREPLIFGSYIV